jgi:ankyrin repeat protein
VSIATLLNRLVVKYPDLAFAHNHKYLRDVFGGSERISKAQFNLALKIYGGDLDAAVAPFRIEEKFLFWELKQRGIDSTLQKFPLIAAADQGFHDLVRLYKKEDVNLKLSKTVKQTRLVGDERLPVAHMSALSLASIKGFVDCCKELINLKADISVDIDGPVKPPLQLAILQGHDDVCRVLIDAGVSIDQPYWGETPLYTATDKNQIGIVKLLLELGADPDATGPDKWTPLHGAASHGNLTLIRIFIEAGSDVDSKTDEGCSPLDIAAKFSKVQSCRALLDAGSCPESVDDNGWTALHVAAWKANMDVCNVMLKSCCNKQAKCKQGRTALHVAALNNNAGVCQQFVESGCIIEARDGQGWTPLHLAAFTNSLEAIKVLMGLGASIHTKCFGGRTPLHTAVDAHHPAIYRHLLEAGAHIDAQSKEGETPLHVAATKGDYKAVNFLIESGCNINATCKMGKTALHYAVIYGKEKIISLFGAADLDAEDFKGNTALHYACEKSPKAKSMVNSLLGMGALIRRNHEGITPIEKANANGLKELAAMMKSKAIQATEAVDERPQTGEKRLPLYITEILSDEEDDNVFDSDSDAGSRS